MANEQILRSFGAPIYIDGSNPQSALVQGGDGALYGTTIHGGINADAGTVFRMNLDGSGYRLLHQFGSFAGDGASPYSPLVQGRDGTLYGTTSGGGTNGSGVIFRIGPDGSSYSVIYEFPRTLKSNFATLILGTDGILYGTALGAAFRLNTDGSGFTVLRALGQTPQRALLQGADGLLYGVIPNANIPDFGIVFKLSPDGSFYSVICNFGVEGVINDGTHPESPLVQSADGTLYGTTADGGLYGLGMIYQIQPDGSGYRPLLNFQGQANAAGSGLLVSKDGWLYGLYTGAGTRGQVFKLFPGTNIYEVVHDFSDNDGPPTSALILATNGLLYGTILQSVYELKPDGSSFTILHTFGTAYGDGAGPNCTLTQTPDATLFGTTWRGGTNGEGIVFQLGPDGTGYKLLHGFGDGTNDGAYPNDGVVLGNDYGLYGQTAYGGISNAGTIYRLDLDGANYRVLHHFGTTPDDGSGPNSRLTLGTDGTFYGTTSFGGTSNFGTVFQTDRAGTTYRVLHTFGTEVPSAVRPETSLVQDNNGTLYGTTYAGGTYGGGAIFSLKPDGTEFRLLHSFAFAGNGGLVMGHDGNLYGISASVPSRLVAVFRIAPDGTGFTIIKTIDRPTMGGNAALSQAMDGTLFGVSSGFEEGPPGFAFRLNTDGTGFGVIHLFADSFGNTIYPEGALMPGVDGALYGTTDLGGAFRGGTVFRLTSAPIIPPILSITPAATAGFHVSAVGVIGSTYNLETSTDLFNWYTLGTVSNETGLVDFFEWNKTTNSQRFFRMLQMTN